MFRLMLLLTLLSQSSAQTPAVVLVAPFEPQNTEAAGLASMLPDFLGQQLAELDEVQPLFLYEIGLIHDVPAEDYAASCPAGEFVGCAYVLAEAGGAAYAVTGTVQALQSGNRVDVRIVDVSSASEVTGFVVDMGTGDDAVFADGVARVLGAVIRGDIGAETDIRQEGGVAPAEGPDKEVASTELKELDTEIGDVSTLDVREDGRIEQERYTIDDLAVDMEDEGTKPWERLEMSPREFLRFKNSGLHLYEWRKLSEGRKGKLLIRGSLGYGRGPSSGAYYGRVALSAQTLEVAETYAWQTMETASGVSVSGAVGYGILPEIEVGLTGGLVTGRFEVDIHRITIGDFSTSPDPVDYASQTLYIGPQVLYVPMPTSTIRPVVGGLVTVWRGSAVGSHVLPPAELPGGGVLDPLQNATALMVGGLGGVEVRMSETLDLWAHVPVGAVIGTWNAPAVYHEGEGALEPEGLLVAAPEPGSISAGVQVGVQVRLGREKKGGHTLEEYD